MYSRELDSLQTELEGLKSARDLKLNLLNKLREHHSVEIDVIAKMKLEVQIKDTKSDLNRFNNEIDQLHHQIEQAKLKSQEEFRQQEERRQQEQQKIEYENNLKRYEKEFIKAISVEYPFSVYVQDGLRNFQQSLMLRDEDIIRVERHHREQAEARYQEKLQKEQEKSQSQQKQTNLQETQPKGAAKDIRKQLAFLEFRRQVQEFLTDGVISNDEEIRMRQLMRDLGISDAEAHQILKEEKGLFNR